jgi:electron transport complex protein RnfG
MKKTFLIPLLSIALVAAVLLGLSFGLQGIATANAQEEHLQTMKTLLPGSTEFTKESYTGDDPLIRCVHEGQTGFVIETATKGYADEIVLWVGVSKEGKVMGLVVRDIHETYGLGNTALTDWEFLAQYLGNKEEFQVGENVDAISGATVTSKAITRCVNSAVAFVTGADTNSGATSWGG